MKAVGIALFSAAALAHPAYAKGVDPAQAAGSALMQCVAHSTGQGRIVSSNAAALATNGLSFQTTPPPFLAQMAKTPYGIASYAAAASSEGQVWTVGYDGPGNACLVIVLGTLVGPIEQRFVDMFAIPDAWKPETPAPADKGERKLQYGWQIDDGEPKLTALVSIRDLAASPAKGMVMVTISWTSKD